MKTRQSIMILLVGISLILGMSAAVADELTRTTEEAPIDETVDDNSQVDQEPLIAPAPDTEPKTEDIEYDNVVGEDLPDDQPHILDVGNDNPDSEETIGLDMENEESDETTQKSSLGLPVAIGIVLAGLIVIGLIFFKRR
jgi:hypothetical protein